MVPRDDDSAPIEYALTEAAQEHPDPDSETFGRSVWELGVVSSQLSPLHRLVALVLATAADDAGRILEEAQPTLRDLQSRTGLALHQLHYLLRDLAHLGWITRETTRLGSTARTRYQLALPFPPHLHGRLRP